MKISLCVTSMNRLGHLEETFLKNIEDNRDYDNLEFVLLNYNSSDEIDQWARDCLSGYIQEGRVSYIQERSAMCFLPSHSRNVCLRMATGDVVCNVDADNFTGQGFASFLSGVFSDILPRIANTYDLFNFQFLSTHGRIALRKWHFVKMGGYDESLIGWGSEDGDLNRRCMAAGFKRCVIPPCYLGFIDHSDEVRAGLIDFSPLGELHKKSIIECKNISNEMNWRYSVSRTKKKMFVANFGKVWGQAVVTKNFKDIIKLGTTWVKW